MSSFDIIDSAGNGYRLLWTERHYILRLAAIPFLIKLVCYMVLVLLGWEENFIRQALVMLISYFADGWMLAHLVRFIFFGQRWPFKPTGRVDEDMALLQDRAAGIVTGALVFAFTKYIMTGSMAMLSYIDSIKTVQGVAEAQPADGAVFISLILVTVFCLWVFRFIWLYIPAAVNYSIIGTLRAMGGLQISLYLIGTWLVCFLPVFFVMNLGYSMIASVFDPKTFSLLSTPISHFLRVGLDTFLELLTTAGMSYGFYSMLVPKKSDH